MANGRLANRHELFTVSDVERLSVALILRGVQGFTAPTIFLYNHDDKKHPCDRVEVRESGLARISVQSFCRSATCTLFNCRFCSVCPYPTGRRSFASSSSRQADITLTVDGKEVTVPQGQCIRLLWVDAEVIEYISLLGSALIQACEAAGSPVPRYE